MSIWSNKDRLADMDCDTLKKCSPLKSLLMKIKIMNPRFLHWLGFYPLRLAVYLIIFIGSLFALLGAFKLYLETRYSLPLIRGLYYFALTPYVDLAVGILSLLIYRGMVACIEKRPVSELSGRKLVQALVIGALLGAGLMAAACCIMKTLGASVENASQLPGIFSPDFGYAAMKTAGVAVSEEILFRGILFRIFQQGFGTGIALGLSALMFGLLHAMNPDSSIVTTLSIAIEAGLPLAMAYTVTQRLWLPIGLHFGWNLAYTQLLGPDKADLSIFGNDAFGLLASIISALPNIALAGYLGWRTKLKGLWVPAKLRMRVERG